MEKMIAGKEITVPSNFRITIPKSWSWKLEEGFVVRHPDLEGSGLFIEGEHVELTSETVVERLKDIAGDFVNQHIAKGNPNAILDAVATTVGDGSNEYTFRSILAVDGQKLWVVQVVARVDRQVYYIIHWCGPFEVLHCYVIPVLDTFEILDEHETKS